ncbi:MAG: hypothetical protein ACRBBR_06620 [Cellvibrionaceae bacterium]
MSEYQPNKIRPLRIIAMLFRAIGSLLSIWPLLLVAVFFISPTGPHLRMQYTYEERNPYYRHYLDCNYLGAKGFVKYRGEFNTCPFVVMIDRRIHH